MFTMVTCRGKMNFNSSTKRFKISILSFICWFCIAVFSGSHAFSFNVPEMLIYDLTWAGIKAGTASLEVVDDGDKMRIISIARSATWLSVFYTVDDRVESILFKKTSPPLFGQPLNYRLKIREGRHRRDKEVIFDLDNGKAIYLDHLENEKKEFDMPIVVFDPISSFYYLRNHKLVVGESVHVTIFDSKKIWNVEVQVLRREKVTLPIGTFDTIVIKPLMKSEGIFYRKGEIFIWLTDDMKRIPVKMQTKVAVGYITATLVRGSY
jgi:hypothetical protein